MIPSLENLSFGLDNIMKAKVLTDDFSVDNSSTTSSSNSSQYLTFESPKNEEFDLSFESRYTRIEQFLDEEGLSISMPLHAEKEFKPCPVLRADFGLLRRASVTTSNGAERLTEKLVLPSIFAKRSSLRMEPGSLNLEKKTCNEHGLSSFAQENKPENL